RVPELARQHAEGRRNKVIGDKELIAGFGVPLRRREDATPTYAVAPKRREIAKPAARGYRGASPSRFFRRRITSSSSRFAGAWPRSWSAAQRHSRASTRRGSATTSWSSSTVNTRAERAARLSTTKARP